MGLPPPVAALVDELVEEVLLRLPLDDPASLVRAALVCKPWCRLIAGASFRRRFRELHPAPPMLAFLKRGPRGTDFVPASSFRPPHAVRGSWCVLDARHGRVLAKDLSSISELVVWDPITDEQRRLPMPRFRHSTVGGGAAVLCATAGCDHLGCSRGPFLVVIAVTDALGERRTYAHVYSSEEGAWSETISVQHQDDWILRGRCALVGNALFFNYNCNTRILEYDLGEQELSIINLPSAFHGWNIVLMTAEGGGLGFATVQESKLCIWSREAGPNSYDGWAQRRVIELDKALPVSVSNHLVLPYVCAIADGISVIFVWTRDGLFTIHLKSEEVKNLGEGILNPDVVTYMSFCVPALSPSRMGDEGPRADASSASQI